MIRSDFAKLAIAIVLDLLDFTVGRMLGVGTVMDIVFAAVAFALWGPIGLLALWEVADPSEQIDGFAPTMTLIALSQMGKSKKKAAPEPLEPPRR